MPTTTALSVVASEMASGGGCSWMPLKTRVKAPRLTTWNRHREGNERHATCLWRELRQFIGLGVNPAKGLELTQVLVLWQSLGHVDSLMRAPLRWHDNAPNLLDLTIVRRRDAVEVATNLRAQIGDGDELLEDILGQNVGVAVLLNIIRAHVDVVGAKVEIGRGDGTHSPLRLTTEMLLLVVGGGGGDDLLAVLIHCLRGGGGELGLVLRRLLDLRDLLALLRGRGDLHAQDDVADLRLGQRGHIHAAWGGGDK